jgi:hypothetical protein
MVETSRQWKSAWEHLQQTTTSPVLPKAMLPEYFVRKDNCITYRGNYYSIPSGTYSGPGAKTLLEIKGSSMCIYSVTRQVLAQHVISQQKGCLVRLETHRRPSGIKVEQTQAEVTILLNHNNAALYLSLLKEDQPRYFHDSLKVILKGLKGASQQAMAITPDIFLENKIYNAYEFVQVLSL